MPRKKKNNKPTNLDLAFINMISDIISKVDKLAKTGVLINYDTPDISGDIIKKGVVKRISPIWNNVDGPAELLTNMTLDHAKKELCALFNIPSEIINDEFSIQLDNSEKYTEFEVINSKFKE